MVKFKKYEEWVKSKGAIIEKCKLKWKHSLQNNLVATQDIKKGETVVGIPYAQWMPLEALMADSPICLKLNEKGELTKKLSHPWRNSFFACWFIEQQKLGEKSKCREYVSFLPNNQHIFPENYTEKEMEMLKGCEHIAKKLELKNKVIQHDYDLLLAANPAIKDTVSLEEFKQGRTWAASRAYDLAFTDGQTRQVLVPFLEFSPINHGSELNVKCMQVDNHMKLMACKDIKKGDVIVQQQAKASNTDVLMNTGFCAENNGDRNNVVVDISLD